MEECLAIINENINAIICDKRIEYKCDCGVMQFSVTRTAVSSGGNKLACAKCGEYKLISITEDIKTETKDYSTVAHCQIWLNRLQGKDCILLSDENRDSLITRAKRKCTVAGRFQFNLVSMITCEEIREWLRDASLTHYNKNIATIRRIITRELGREIIPPQFTMEEEKNILDEWNRVAECYQANYRIMKNSAKHKTNNPYYPICIYFIVARLFPCDFRVAQLYEYIHRQSLETMELRKRCWDRTIEQLNVH